MSAKLDEATAIAKIKAKITYIESLRRLPRDCPEFKKWYREVTVLLTRIFGVESAQLDHFHAVSFWYTGMYAAGDERPFEAEYRRGLEDAAAILTSICEEIQEFGLTSVDPTVGDPIAIVEKITMRFHDVARQLRRRHGNRVTLDVKDEFDVQNLMHALLKLFFNDVRPEEWTPSYAGTSSRMDFLLHEEQLVIEFCPSTGGGGDFRPFNTDANTKPNA